MAVITYKVSVDAGGNPSIDPSPDSIELVQKDFLIFTADLGTQIRVQLRGTDVICAIYADPPKKLVMLKPTVDGEGNVIIAFEAEGGARGEWPPY